MKKRVLVSFVLLFSIFISLNFVSAGLWEWWSGGKEVLLSPAGNLVAHYKFEGNVNDETGNNPGTNHGIKFVDGKFGKAGKFDGSAYLDMGNLEDYFDDEATLIMWVKLNKKVQNSVLANLGTTHPYGVRSYYYTTAYPWTNGKLYIDFFRNSRINNINNKGFDKSRWHMLTIVNKPGTDGYKIYQNEKEIYSGKGVNKITLNTRGNELIGSDYSYPYHYPFNHYFRGLIDEVKIWNKALSYDEIKREYEVGSCTLDCSGKECGGDGCGGSCGSCVSGENCNDAGVCVDQTVCQKLVQNITDFIEVYGSVDCNDSYYNPVLDVTKDGEITPIDILTVVNKINGLSSLESEAWCSEKLRDDSDGCGSGGESSGSESSSSSGSGGGEATCTDSDGGVEQETPGETNYIAPGINDTDYDTCVNDSILSEQYCPDVNSENRQQIFSCSNGCITNAEGKGYCNESVVTCTDSDGGNNYYVKGTAEAKWNNQKPSTDFCNKGSAVNRPNTEVSSCSGSECYAIDFYCDSSDNDIMKWDKQICPNGCENGACIKPQCDDNIDNDADGLIDLRDSGCENSEDNSEYSQVTCTDSDNGKDKYVFGTTCLNGECKNDTCWIKEYDNGENQTYLEEFYCNEERDYIYSDKYNHCAEECNNGACERTIPVNNGVCQDLINKTANPMDFSIYGLDYKASNWNSNYESSWWINERQEQYIEYSASWNVYRNDRYNEEDSHENVHINVNLMVFENEDIDLTQWMEDQTSYDICKIESYWDSEDKENIVYICTWDILRNNQDLDNYKHKSRQIIWVKDNVAIKIYVSSGASLTDEEVTKIAQKRFNDYINDLKNNEAKYVDWKNFDISYLAREFISQSLRGCSSDVQRPVNDRGEECFPSWSCKLEPAICPPHGYQTRICNDYSCNQQRKEHIYCSPGICDGCMIPRSIWDTNSVCIPYGTRLVFNKGEEYRMYESEMNKEGGGYFNISINNDYSMDIKVIKDLLEDDVSFIVEGITYNVRVGESKTVYQGNTYDIRIMDGRYVEDYSITLKNIHYSDNPEERYIDMVFNEEYPSYCNYDGKINQQRTVDYQGNWAKCQNNYECESNVCSSGQCIEVTSMIEQAKGFKGFFVKLICKMSNLFNVEDYETCVTNVFGGNLEEGSDSGPQEVEETIPEPSSGGGGGSPPPLPE